VRWEVHPGINAGEQKRTKGRGRTQQAESLPKSKLVSSLKSRVKKGKSGSETDTQTEGRHQTGQKA